MKIYTRKGDRGETAMLGGVRVPKSDPRIRALGVLDELNAALGRVIAEPSAPSEILPFLNRTQNVLFEAGAALASTDPAPYDELLQIETEWMEREIDRMEASLPPITRFLLPGGCPAGADLHTARAIARRAECQTVETAEGEAADGKTARTPLLTWLNRLSDALFVLARTANRLAGTNETHWESKARKGRI